MSNGRSCLPKCATCTVRWQANRFSRSCSGTAMTTRRGNGEGHPRKRPDGRWELQVSVDGQRRSLYGKTRQEVLRKRKELDLAPRSQTSETVAELAAVWL